MRNRGITFGELRDLLLSLGCSVVAEKDRTTFAHPALGTFLLFRAYAPKEPVNERDMLVVRRQLIDNGLIEPSALAHRLQTASA